MFLPALIFYRCNILYTLYKLSDIASFKGTKIKVEKQYIIIPSVYLNIHCWVSLSCLVGI